MKKEDGETRTASNGKNSKIEPVDNTSSSNKKISELVKVVKEYGEKDEQQKLNVPENGEPQYSLALGFSRV